MNAVNITIKVQNELAKKAIILALKDWSHGLFQNNGLMFRCFVDRTENQVEIFHVFRSKKEMEEVRKSKSDDFWNQIKEMGVKFLGLKEIVKLKSQKAYKILI